MAEVERLQGKPAAALESLTDAVRLAASIDAPVRIIGELGVSMALVRRDLGDLKAAEELIVWALKCLEEALDPDHPDIARVQKIRDEIAGQASAPEAKSSSRPRNRSLQKRR
jgi:hypothetical protein